MDDNLVGSHRDLNRLIGASETTLDELHGAGGNNRLALALTIPLGLGRPLHLGQPTAVGADRDHTRGSKLHEHAAEGVSARFVIGSKDRAFHEFSDERGCEFETTSLRKTRHRRKLERILGRQPKLAPGRLDDCRSAIGVDVEHGARGTLPDDRHQPTARKKHGARRVGLHAFDLDANAHFQVGRGQNHRVSRRLEFDVGEHGFRRTGRYHGDRTLQGGQQCLLGAANLHRQVVSFPGMGMSGSSLLYPKNGVLERDGVHPPPRVFCGSMPLGGLASALLSRERVIGVSRLGTAS